MELLVRKIGNSAGIIFPAALLKLANLSIGSIFEAEVIGDNLVLTPSTKSYTLSELLAHCNSKAAPPADSIAWQAVSSSGNVIK